MALSGFKNLYLDLTEFEINYNYYYSYWRLHLPSSKHRTSANASNNGERARLTVSSHNGITSVVTGDNRGHM
jgi:hypothetical protein